MEEINSKITFALQYLQIDCSLLAKMTSEIESTFVLFLLQRGCDYE